MSSRIKVNLIEFSKSKVGEITVKSVPSVGEEIAIIAKPDINYWSGKVFKVKRILHLVNYPKVSEITLYIKEIE